jgi:excisionase family DNA binding protein
MVTKEYLTTPEAAEYLGVSTQWLEIARHRGTGPKFCKLSRMVRYKRSDLDQFMQERSRTNTIQDAQPAQGGSYA